MSVEKWLISRRATVKLLIGGCGAALLSPTSFARSPRGNSIDGLPRVRPESAGVDPQRLLGFLADAKAAGIELHSLMLYRHGGVVAEGWWWPYRPDLVHMMHSLTKSVTVCAVGWALAEGRFGLNDKVVSFFKDELPEDLSDNLSAMTVEDLLTMRTGHDHQTSGSVWRPIKTSWIAEFFKIPVVYKPGTKWVYTSAATYMLSALITKTTKLSTYEYLKPRLFEPLDIQGQEWPPGPQDITPGANGLSWHTADVLKLGILHLQNGIWNGVQVLPKGWAQKVHQPHVPVPTDVPLEEGWGWAARASGIYGYQWWLGPNGAYFAAGMFGQFSFVFPEHDAVLAVTAGSDEDYTELVFKHFPNVFKMRAAAHRQDFDAMRSAMSQLRILSPLSKTYSPIAAEISGKTFKCEKNEDDIAEIQLDFYEDSCTCFLRDYRGDHEIKCGLWEWTEGHTPMTGNKLHHEYQPDIIRVVAGGAWKDPQTFEMTWQFVESAFRDTVVCHFGSGILSFDRKVNANSGSKVRPTIRALMA